MYQMLGHNLPGVPRAPVLKFNNIAQFRFEEKKERLNSRLPILTQDDISRYRHPQTFLFQRLLNTGYENVVSEILQLKRKQQSLDKDPGLCWPKTPAAKAPGPKQNLLNDASFLTKVADILKLAFNNEIKGNATANITNGVEILNGVLCEYMLAAQLRFNLAEELIKSNEFRLANHFLSTALETTVYAEPDQVAEFQAKLNCCLAFVGRKIPGHSVDSTIHNAEKCRKMSKGKMWWFNGKGFNIEIEKPISIYGLDDDSETFPCGHMSLHRVATFLYFDILSHKIATIVEAPDFAQIEELSKVTEMAQQVIKMARKIRNPLAEASALTRYGKLLRQSGAFDAAMEVFTQLAHDSELGKDFQSLAIAYGYLAICCEGRGLPLDALKMHLEQFDLSHTKNFSHLQADAVLRMANILLSEGDILEAEQSAFEALMALNANKRDSALVTSDLKTNVNEHKEDKKEEEPPEKIVEQMEDHCWTLAGITSGQNLWGRYAGLCRQNNKKTTESLLNWRGRREIMPRVPRPNYEINPIYDVFDKIQPEKKIPESCCYQQYDCFKKSYREYKEHLELFEKANLPGVVANNLRKARVPVTTAEGGQGSKFNLLDERSRCRKKEVSRRVSLLLGADPPKVTCDGGPCLQHRNSKGEILDGLGHVVQPHYGHHHHHEEGHYHGHGGGHEGHHHGYGHDGGHEGHHHGHGHEGGHEGHHHGYGHEVGYSEDDVFYHSDRNHLGFHKRRESWKSRSSLGYESQYSEGHESHTSRGQQHRHSVGHESYASRGQEHRHSEGYDSQASGVPEHRHSVGLDSQASTGHEGHDQPGQTRRHSSVHGIQFAEGHLSHHYYVGPESHQNLSRRSSESNTGHKKGKRGGKDYETYMKMQGLPVDEYSEDGSIISESEWDKGRRYSYSSSNSTGDNDLITEGGRKVLIASYAMGSRRPSDAVMVDGKLTYTRSRTVSQITDMMLKSVTEIQNKLDRHNIYGRKPKPIDVDFGKSLSRTKKSQSPGGLNLTPTRSQATSRGKITPSSRISKGLPALLNDEKSSKNSADTIE